MLLTDFDFILPESLIAKRPLPNRSESKLLCFNRNLNTISDKVFFELNSMLKPNDLLVFNNTKVLNARILGKKNTGGNIECLIEDYTDDVANCIVKGKNLRLQQELLFPEGIVGTIINIEKERKQIQFNLAVKDIMEKIGQIPIPPYFNRDANSEDVIRYQTIYASEPGAIAAPTAGLHFDQELIDNLIVKTASITLHVGAGTFKPVTSENINEHIMQYEKYEISKECALKINQCKQEQGRVIAVGSTVLRALETMMKKNNIISSDQGQSDLFITPGFKFECVDALITNFHLPKSTLLMLVSAFMGHDMMHQCYQHAIKNQYRFYSYGDAMLIL